MNVHKHARMTSHGRLLLVQRIRAQGWRRRLRRAAYRFARPTSGWRGIGRGGEPALHDRRSTPAGRRVERRPRSSPPSSDCAVNA
ncbi:MAG: leucine zipper domain-containing protein [Rhodoplanes sp.]